MKHAIERAVDALEPLSDEDRALAVRLAARGTSAPAKKTKRKYTKRKALGEGLTPPVATPAVSPLVETPAEEKERKAPKPSAKKGGLAALKARPKARPLREAE